VIVFATAVTAVASCKVGDLLPPPPSPVISSAAVAAGPYNVLSAVVSVSLMHADSVRVRFGAAGAALDSVAPVTALSSNTAQLPVLGLLPSTTYRMQVVAYGAKMSIAGDTLVFTTGTLPIDLPAYSAGGSAPAPGFVVFGAYPYGVVIDNTGRVVWYRHLDQAQTLNFQVQPTGRYTTMPITAPTGDATPWVEFDALGNVTRHMGCANGLIARFHELREMADGSYWLLCDDVRTMDLTPYGGLPDAVVTGTAVQHVDSSGHALFAWTPFDHFAITDLDPASRTGPAVNWTHGNAIDFDADGSLIVSFRSLSEITKIELPSGAVRWRMGGLANQFTFSGAGASFAGQHGLRVVGPGQLELLDNRGLPGESHAERYVLDEAAHTATLTASYFSLPPSSAILGGSTQALPAGHVLVAYGNGNRVQEYDAAGNVVWEIHGNPGYVFRAQRIVSLYRPGAGTP
jgi:hypothetical protein